MGISRIDFGQVEGNKFGVLAESDSDGWLAEAVGFKFKAASTGNFGIEVTYKITDEAAVDVDGEPYKGKAWDRFWFSTKAASVTKDKLAVLGVDVSELVIEDENDIKDLVTDLSEDAVGTAVRLVTVVEPDYKDETKQRSNVKYVNEAV